MNRQRFVRRSLAVLLPIVLFPAVTAGRIFLFQPGLDVGPKTTVVDGPLRSDGTVDYVTALNTESSEGVTPENNAAVLLAEAFGPDAIAPEIRDRHFALLGVEQPPEEGAYLVPLEAFLTRQGTSEERRQDLLRSGPDANQPEVAAWVEASKLPLDQIVRATRREHFFMPVLPPAPAGTQLESDFGTLQRCREAARLLRTRAFLRLEAGDVHGACEDAIACHRLGRLVSRHPTLMGYLYGTAIDALATEISETIVVSNQLTPELGREVRAEIENLLPFGDVAETLDRGERFVSLDAAQPLVVGTKSTGVFGVPARGLDPNVLFRETNAFYDSYVAAMRDDDYASRVQKLDALDQAFKARAAGQSGLLQVAYMAIRGRAAITRSVSDVLLSLLSPAVRQAQAAEDRALVRAELCRIGWTVAEYKAVEGAYPASLEDLIPQYVDKIPLDPFSAEPLKYDRTQNGFLLSSVGPDGEADGLAPEVCPDRTGDCDDLHFGQGPKELPVR